MILKYTSYWHYIYIYILIILELEIKRITKKNIMKRSIISLIVLGTLSGYHSLLTMIKYGIIEENILTFMIAVTCYCIYKVLTVRTNKMSCRG